MNGQINQLVKSLLKKDSLDQCSVAELQQFADRHPYFGAAQLLLTKKLQIENDDQYNEQLQKTFLFFHNPLWVEQLLNETGKASITATQPTVVDKIISPEIIPGEKMEPGDKNPVSEISGNNTNDPIFEIPTLKNGPAGNEKTDLVFEPYYTVDYFASQGIQFKEEEKPKDKFGQQLKSFTDWLRTMKRLPELESTVQVEVNSDQKVEQLARHSLEEKEVLTPAMAEVWEKQGNTLKAIEIYNKLSLLDPSKSVYFAAKIEEIKKKI